MFRKISLTVLALVIFPTCVNAEFAVDSFSTGASFFGTSVDLGTNADEFGNNFSGILRTTSGSALTDSGSGNVAFNSFGGGGDFVINYDFTAPAIQSQSPSDTFSLGYYAQNFQISGLNPSPSTALFDINVAVERGSGLTDSFTLAGTNLSSGSAFFDFTNLANVGILNDLHQLTFTFTTTSAVNLGFSNFRLVATPEPTSLISLGAFAALGLTMTQRRRRRG